MLVFWANDYPKYMEIMKQRGVEVTKDSKFGPVSVAILKDNSGNTIEIVDKVIPNYYEVKEVWPELPILK